MSYFINYCGFFVCDSKTSRYCEVCLIIFRGFLPFKDQRPIYRIIGVQLTKEKDFDQLTVRLNLLKLFYCWLIQLLHFNTVIQLMWQCFMIVLTNAVLGFILNYQCTKRASNKKGLILVLFVLLFIFLLLFVKAHSKTKKIPCALDLYSFTDLGLFLISLCGYYLSAKNNNKNGIIGLTYIILFRLV